jgi:hypothetical protein
MFRLDAVMMCVGVIVTVRFVTAMLAPVRMGMCIVMAMRESASVLAMGLMLVRMTVRIAAMLMARFVPMLRSGTRSGWVPMRPNLDRLLPEWLFLRCGRQHQAETANCCNPVTHEPPQICNTITLHMTVEVKSAALG